MLSGSTSIRELARVVAPLVILVIGVGGFLILKGREDVPTRAAEAEDAPLVDTAAVVPHSDTLTLEVDGQVVPYLEVDLSAEVAGRVLTKADVCRAGKFVRKGQLLLEIDPEDYRLEKERLSQELQQADVSLKELEVEAENTEKLIELAEEDVDLQEKDLARQTKLLADSATSQAALDQAKRSVLQASNTLLTLRNQLNLLNTRRARLESAKKVMQVRIDQAARDLQRTQVTSPIDGMVVSESVEEDSYVQPGTPLVTLEDTSVVEVRCHLRMDELYWVWSQVSDRPEKAGLEAAEKDYQLPETPVTVVYRLAGQEYIWQGVLWRYDGIGLDERTRTVPCRVRVDSPREVQIRTPEGLVEPASGPRALVRGMFVNLEIHTKPKAELLRVPEVAIQPGDKVWRVRDDRLHQVDVDVVDIRDEAAVLRVADEALRSGDNVVVSPLAEATEGMVVQQRDPDGRASAATSRVALATEDEAR